MSATQLYKAGYTDLVSVVPPGARISPNSRIDPTQAGKCPGKLGQNGWYGYDFVRKPLTADEIPRVDSWKANVGVLGARFPALDIDSENDQFTEVVLSFAKKHLGLAPVRLSRGPRRLLIYRTDQPFPRRALKATYKGQEHTVEFLGEGRQYLVHGLHPSGEFYRFAGKPLWEIPPDKLNAITAEKADAFLDALGAALGSKGVACERVGDRKPSEATPPQEELRAPSIEALAETVARIPNDDRYSSREDYILFGHAVKAAAGQYTDRGLDVFLEWASRWDGGENDPDTVTADWDRMRPPFRVGWAWLQDQAGDGAQNDFQPLDAALPDPIPGGEPDVALTDEFFVNRMVHLLRPRLRYVPGKGNEGSWWRWSGHQWTEDLALGHEVEIRALLKEEALHWNSVAQSAPGKEGAPYAAAARRIQSAAGIAAIVRLLRARLATAITEFDQNPWELNTPEGLFDLQHGTVRKPTPADMVTKSTAYPAAKPDGKLWAKFLETLTAGDKDLEKFLQRYIGYSLTGSMAEKVLVFAWGSNSDTGKSTFVRTVKAVMGDYAKTTNVQAFMTSSRGTVPDHIAQLLGVRLTTATEPSQGQEWDDEMLKAIIGDDEIQVRRFFGSWFDFRPQFKILIAGNHEPELKKVTDSMRRRILIVPMNNRVPAEEQIAGLDRKMVETEGPAILGWMLEGCRAWQAEGLNPPDAVKATTDRYWKNQDTLARWISEECVLEPEAQESRRSLYDSWAGWARRVRVPVGSETLWKADLDARLEEFGLTETRVATDAGRLRGYRGIRVREDLGVGL